jgi:hypothetical protein
MEGGNAFCPEFCQLDKREPFYILEFFCIPVPGRQYEYGKAILDKFFQEMYPESVDAPAGIGDEGNSFIRGHTKQTY